VLFRALVSLLGGFISTIIVALFCLATAEVNNSQGRDPVRPVRPSWLPKSWPEATRAERWRPIVYGYSHTETYFETGPLPGNEDGETYVLSRMTFGWPFPAIERYSSGVLWRGTSGGDKLLAFWAEFEAAAGLREGVIPPDWFPRDKGLGPHIPVWPAFPGFLLNVVSYGSGIFLIWITPGIMIRARRTRRRQCLHCGYDRRGLEDRLCPECGS
jgi:hypothetical protein